MLLALTYAPPSVCKLARIEIVPAHYFICRHPSSLPNLGLVMLLPNTPFCSTAATCSAPCPPAASAKRNVQVMSSAAAARGRKPLSPVKKKKGGGNYLRCLLPGGRSQQISCRAAPCKHLYHKTSVRRQVPIAIGDHASWRNRCEGSGLLWRMRPGASRGAQFTIWPISRAILSCRNRCAALPSLYDVATTMSRCQRSAAPATDSMFSYKEFCVGLFFLFT